MLCLYYVPAIGFLSQKRIWVPSVSANIVSCLYFSLCSVAFFIAPQLSKLEWLIYSLQPVRCLWAAGGVSLSIGVLL